MNLIMLERVVALLAVLGGQWQLSTVFGSSRWDRHNPNSQLACYRRPIDDRNDMLVAHNTLPCRQQVLLINPRTQQVALARVGDRGPRHAGIDLSLRVAQQLGHNGKEYILVIPIDDDGATSGPAGSISALNIRNTTAATAAALSADVGGDGAQQPLVQRPQANASRLYASGQRPDKLSATRALRQQLQAAAEAQRVLPESQASRPVEVGLYPGGEATMVDVHD